MLRGACVSFNNRGGRSNAPNFKGEINAGGGKIAILEEIALGEAIRPRFQLNDVRACATSGAIIQIGVVALVVGGFNRLGQSANPISPIKGDAFGIPHRDVIGGGGHGRNRLHLANQPQQKIEQPQPNSKGRNGL